MTDTITLTGLVATVPRHVVTSGNVPITSFRLASTQRRYDRVKGQWVDAETNWYTISAFRQLAFNAAQSVDKGDRVVVTGRVRLRDWSTAEKSGMTVDVEADALGHDLTWGTARWVRTSSSAAGTAGREDAGAASDTFGTAPAGPDASGDARFPDPDDATDIDGASIDRTRVDGAPADGFSSDGIGASEDDDAAEGQRFDPVRAETPF